MIYSDIVRAFSLDNLFLSLKTNSQYLVVVKPSVAKVIFLSNPTKEESFSSLSDADDEIFLLLVC